MAPVFDLFTSKDLFYEIKKTFNTYKNEPNKDICKLLFIIMGLNHLREWIAPGYHYDKKSKRMPLANTPEKQFYQNIYNDTKNSDFQIINELCNYSKHFKTLHKATSCRHGTIDEWENLDNVRDFDEGAVLQYFVKVDGKYCDITNVICKTIKYYDENWFKQHP